MNMAINGGLTYCGILLPYIIINIIRSIGKWIKRAQLNDIVNKKSLR